MVQNQGAAWAHGERGQKPAHCTKTPVKNSDLSRGDVTSGFFSASVTQLIPASCWGAGGGEGEPE